MPDDIEKYARGLYGPRSQTEYTSSVFVSGDLTKINADRVITFEYDNYGFRKEEGLVKKRAAFGCSHTFGFELEESSTWPFLLNATNFGVTGASPQTVARLVNAWVPNSDIEEVLILMPVHERLEIHNPLTHTYTPAIANFVNYIAKTVYEKDRQHLTVEDLMLEFFGKYEEMNVLDFERNERIHAECVERIEQACVGRKLIIKEMTDVPPQDYQSRDGTHSGEKWNRKVASIFKKSLDISA